MSNGLSRVDECDHKYVDAVCNTKQPSPSTATMQSKPIGKTARSSRIPRMMSPEDTTRLQFRQKGFRQV